MKELRVLFISGSIGLGHVTRDLAITAQLRQELPAADIQWLAADPASLYLRNAGEVLVPEAEDYSSESMFAEGAARGARLNLLAYLVRARGAWQHNVQVFRRIVASRPFDLVIGDETYEISLALAKEPELKKFPFVMIYDFVGLEPATRNPIERFGVHYWNCIWSRNYRLKKKPQYDLGLFVGLPEDVPDKPFGFALPNRQAFAAAMYEFIGYVFPFDPSVYADQAAVKRSLGYGSEPLIIASIGGTAIGREILELCGEAHQIALARSPSLRLLLVTGPRIAAESLRLAGIRNIEIREFVPNLHEHFAACDLAIVQGGATSTLELTALRRPFLYFPIEGHSEQANVARILEERRAGVRMTLSKTTADLLAEKMLSLLGTKVDCSYIPTDGAKKAAQLICRLMDQSGPSVRCHGEF